MKSGSTFEKYLERLMLTLGALSPWRNTDAGFTTAIRKRTGIGLRRTSAIGAGRIATAHPVFASSTIGISTACLRFLLIDRTSITTHGTGATLSSGLVADVCKSGTSAPSCGTGDRPVRISATALTLRLVIGAATSAHEVTSALSPRFVAGIAKSTAATPTADTRDRPVRISATALTLRLVLLHAASAHKVVTAL